ncbi:MAG TPA: indole-3-glycerol phosphate synthase TrpC [Acidimicrobiales bacterium]|nr:indole-3-glycerol phosphate synthase TrpC [Acidimicrobiales bacterium]
MATILDEILAAHRAAWAAAPADLGALREAAAGAPAARDFAGALARAGRAGGGIGVIAEVKRRSPSKGDLAPGLDAAALAAAYAAGGASCLSVLTDADYFGGSEADLVAARAAVALPVLRKDFTVSEADLLVARAMGADAVLLIVAALSDGELARFLAAAAALGLSALVEVHDGAEAARALDAGATLVGVNQRDLRTFEVDGARALAVLGALPDGVVRVAESGIRDAADVARLRDAGFDAVLVGEALVTAADPAARLAALGAGVLTGA